MLEHPLILDTTAVEQRGILGISTHYCCALTPAASWHEERWSELARRGRFARPLSSAPHRPRRRTRLPRHPIPTTRSPHESRARPLLHSHPPQPGPLFPHATPLFRAVGAPPPIALLPCGGVIAGDPSIRSWIGLIFLGKAEVVVLFPLRLASTDRSSSSAESFSPIRWLCCADLLAASIGGAHHLFPQNILATLSSPKVVRRFLACIWTLLTVLLFDV